MSAARRPRRRRKDRASPVPCRAWLATGSNLLRELKVGLGPCTVRIVVCDRQAVAGRLTDPDVSWNHGVEYEIGEVGPDLRSTSAEPRSAVVHCEKHPCHREARVELETGRARGSRAGRPDPPGRSIGLHGHDHPVSGHQRADRKWSQRRGTVQNDVFKAVPEGLTGIPQSILETLQSREAPKLAPARPGPREGPESTTAESVRASWALASPVSTS